MKALSILDKVIKTIRASKDKRDAKNNIISEFEFTEIQAEAIVSLQLYRLTNTDITELEAEDAELRKLIDKLDAILKSDKKLSNVIKKELLDIRKQYAEPRRSVIEEKIENIKVDLDILVPSEEVVVSVTKDGYVKRTSIRSFSASNGTGQDMKESDYSLLETVMNTQHHLLLFTSLGNYLYQPVHELPDIRWRDLGQHISSIISLEPNEEIISAIGIDSFDENTVVLTAADNGNIKLSKLIDYQVQRYSRTFKAMNVKKGDRMVDVQLVNGDEDVVLFTEQAYALRFSLTELSLTGVRTSGVKGINLKTDDKLVSMLVVRDEGESVLIATQRGSVKRMALKELENATRAQRGLVVLKELKSNPHRIIGTALVKPGETVILTTTKDNKIPIEAGSLRLVDRLSNGSALINESKDGNVLSVYKEVKAETK